MKTFNSKSAMLFSSIIVFSLTSSYFFFYKINFTNENQVSSVHNDLTEQKKNHFIHSFGTNKIQSAQSLDPINRISFSEWIENKGQLSNSIGSSTPEVLFYSNVGSNMLFLRTKGISIVPQSYGNLNDEGEVTDSTYLAGHRLDIDFVGMNNNFIVEKQQTLSSYKNYYSGNHPEGIQFVKSYQSIVYRNIYNQTDIIYYAPANGKFKYDFIVNPGATLNSIRLKYNGADSVKIINGILTTYLSGGMVREWMPKVYQNIGGQKIERNGSYYFINGKVGIQVPNYNQSLPLIIDPWVTYYGGSGPDYGSSIITDPSGNIIFSGRTNSINFPVSTGAFQTALSTSWDCIVVKMTPDGIPLWSTYYGGSDFEHGGMCVSSDKSGNILFTGYTSSSDFPISAGAFMPTYRGGFYDAFLVKLDPSGLRSWSTYLGGTDLEVGNVVCLDSSNNIFVAGLTRSLNFPATPGLFSTIGTGADGFVTKFNSSGSMLWSTYYNNTEFKGAATNSLGEIILTGYGMPTTSTTPGSYKTVVSGSADAFITKFSSSGIRKWATFFGGSDFETVYGITTDHDDNILFTGSTLSNDFYVSSSAFQKTRAGVWDGYLVKMNTSGFPIWSTYIGGTGNEEAFGVAVEKATGNVYIAGDTYSNDFPYTDCAYQKTNGGGMEDNYIAKFDKDGYRICSGYIGGTGHDEIDFGYPLATYGNNVYLIAEALGGYPVTPDSYQPILGGGQDAVIASLCGNSCSVENISLNFEASKTYVCADEGIDFLMNEIFLCDVSGSEFHWYFPGGTPSTSGLMNPTGIIYHTPGFYPVRLAVKSGCGKDSISKETYIEVSGCTLSLELISFSGKKKDDGNFLEWSLMGALNHGEEFIVERANEDGQFEFISSVTNEAFNSGIIRMNYLDHPISNNINYYQIKFRNDRGEWVYSKVIAINNDDQFILSIDPNPSLGTTNIFYDTGNGSASVNSKFAITNGEGKLIREGSLNKGQNKIDMNDAADGLYLITIWDEREGKEITRKFILRKE